MFERGDRLAGVAGPPGDVDQRVELLVIEHGERVVTVAVGGQETDAVDSGTAGTTSKASHLVSRVAGVAGDRAAEKHRSTQYQESHRSILTWRHPTRE